MDAAWEHGINALRHGRRLRRRSQRDGRSGAGSRAGGQRFASASSSRRRSSTPWRAARPTRALAPDRIRRQVEASLSRLGAERLDLYLIHEPDPDTPLERDARGARRARPRRQGGASRREQRRAAPSSKRRSRSARNAASPASSGCRTPTACSTRGDEADVLPLCARHGLGYTPFSPLAGGWLTGKYRRGRAVPGRLAHDAAARALPRLRAATGRSAPSRRSTRRPARAASTWRRSPSPGSSPTRA